LGGSGGINATKHKRENENSFKSGFMYQSISVVAALPFRAQTLAFRRSPVSDFDCCRWQRVRANRF
jgi:hypothetical protein